MAGADNIVDAIGEEIFSWLSGKFNKNVTLKDVPDEIINRIVSVDISLRNYMLDPSSITAIAVITFAYKLAGKRQIASFGGKDILLLKVLSKREKARREGKEVRDHSLWNSPLYELITGQVGNRIRNMRCMVGS
ncbi:hypothetical protein ACFL2O_05785 [Thermodesulfobacteriota bacterium]